jgi:hypothetical protein
MEAIAQALDEIRRHCKAMLACHEDDRISLYRKIDPCLLQLEGKLCQNPNARASELLAELKLHLIMVARLYEADDQTDDQHCALALRAIETLRGAQCFAMDS